MACISRQEILPPVLMYWMVSRLDEALFQGLGQCQGVAHLSHWLRSSLTSS